ncbi:Hypp3894 [Branchiostoma lanceolatum]|uniref:Hypp3894 protein n=1 Tax=Branchiostoma lanceolatum TaxID=7740 RepID=A0A8K0ETS8_BRALA|nr:Hypp3894 [Branchiostoma lanceolatum]
MSGKLKRLLVLLLIILTGTGPAAACSCAPPSCHCTNRGFSSVPQNLLRTKLQLRKLKDIPPEDLNNCEEPAIVSFQMVDKSTLVKREALHLVCEATAGTVLIGSIVLTICWKRWTRNRTVGPDPGVVFNNTDTTATVTTGGAPDTTATVTTDGAPDTTATVTVATGGHDQM